MATQKETHPITEEQARLIRQWTGAPESRAQGPMPASEWAKAGANMDQMRQDLAARTYNEPMSVGGEEQLSPLGRIGKFYGDAWDRETRALQQGGVEELARLGLHRGGRFLTGLRGGRQGLDEYPEFISGIRGSTYQDGRYVRREGDETPTQAVGGEAASPIVQPESDFRQNRMRMINEKTDQESQLPYAPWTARQDPEGTDYDIPAREPTPAPVEEMSPMQRLQEMSRRARDGSRYTSWGEERVAPDMSIHQQMQAGAARGSPRTKVAQAAVAQRQQEAAQQQQMAQRQAQGQQQLDAITRGHEADMAKTAMEIQGKLTEAQIQGAANTEVARLGGVFSLLKAQLETGAATEQTIAKLGGTLIEQTAQVLISVPPRQREAVMNILMTYAGPTIMGLAQRRVQEQEQ